jgi:hypothetical protein
LERFFPRREPDIDPIGKAFGMAIFNHKDFFAKALDLQPSPKR